ncbi:Non-specific lipid-transfer protein 3 [Platanthera zijinensis]|uniref:Non-specific lipid-transfer protein 3 n=1 Tax=Platanthera zijinensis TaxID=2320716 RepID=A0AAP0BJG9_9ASPA
MGCVYLKSLAAQILNFNLGLATGLSGKCGVSIPYPISTTTDGTKPLPVSVAGTFLNYILEKGLFPR